MAGMGAFRVGGQAGIFLPRSFGERIKIENEGNTPNINAKNSKSLINKHSLKRLQLNFVSDFSGFLLLEVSS
jgi:hypothetical protein